jgi:hypothetical protein
VTSYRDKTLVLHFKLYVDNELASAYTTTIFVGNAPCDNYVCMGSGQMPWRIGLQYTGEYMDGWQAFRACVDDAAGSRMTEMLPFLVYDRPAQFPSVLVAPCRYPSEPLFPAPRLFVVTAQVPDPLSNRSNDE